MQNDINKLPVSIFFFVVVALFSLYCFNLFKHISFPLLWNDESYGAMNAVRILKYGYPRVHDDKGNMILEPSYGYPLEKCYNSKYDFSTYITWGNEYYSTIGVFWSQFTEDIYLKTALVRIPFALASVLGIIIFIIILKIIAPDALSFGLVSIAFLVMENLSIPFVLHMREARYYSLMVLLQSIFILFWLDFNIYKKLKIKKHMLLLSLFYFITYQINFALVIIFYVTWIVTSAIVMFLNNKLQFKKISQHEGKIYLLSLLPIFISLLLILPFDILIYKSFQTASSLASRYSFFSLFYLKRFLHILKYFCAYEWAPVGLIFMVIFLVIFFKKRYLDDGFRQIYVVVFLVSLFLNVMFIVAMMSISKNIVYFSRYFIVFQPLLLLSIVLEGYICLRWMFQHSGCPVWIRFCVVMLIIIFASINLYNQLPWIKGRIAELKSPYKGPLDFIIPYIIKNYDDPEKLIIATNYETTSYLFYLNCRTIIGYVPFELENDLKFVPDIIIYRKFWKVAPASFQSFFSKANYRPVMFSVYDLPVNYIPELYIIRESLNHQFETVYTNDQKKQTMIFVKSPDA